MEGFYKRQIPFISTFVERFESIDRARMSEILSLWNTSKISHSHYGNAQIQAAISWSTWTVQQTFTSPKDYFRATP